MKNKICKTCGQEIKGFVKQKVGGKTLLWGPDSDKEMTWEEANKWCKKQGGRLPTRSELVQAFDDNVPGFRNSAGVNRYYWSATTISSFTRTYAWNVYLSHGFTYNNTKTNSYYVRCVRLAK